MEDNVKYANDVKIEAKSAMPKSSLLTFTTRKYPIKARHQVWENDIKVNIKC